MNQLAIALLKIFTVAFGIGVGLSYSLKTQDRVRQFAADVRQEQIDQRFAKIVKELRNDKSA